MSQVQYSFHDATTCVGSVGSTATAGSFCCLSPPPSFGSRSPGVAATGAGLDASLLHS